MFCGGSEKSLLALLGCIDRSKYEITLLLMKKKGDLLPSIPNDVQIEEIELPKDEAEDLLVGRWYALKSEIKKRYVLSAIRKAFRAVKMTRAAKSAEAKRLWYYQSIEKKIKDYPRSFDVVIDYFGYGLFNTFYAARKIQGKTKISWVHFEPDQALPNFSVFRDILNEFDYLMCVSGSSMQQVTRMMPELSDKCHIFYNIVDEKSLREQAATEPVKKSTERISVLSVGRLDPQKGFDIAIGAVARLYSEGYPIEWKIIGEGWQRPELETKIAETPGAKDCIELLGQKLNPYPYFSACDIYMQPSRHEGYGIAVAEARAFNKPILATDFAGAREQLIDEKTGLIVTCDENGIYHGLKRIIDSVELRNQFSAALSIEKGNAEKQIQWFESII